MRRALVLAVGMAMALTATTALPAQAQTPSVTGFSPTEGPVGTSVVITGTDFTNASDVQFNETRASTFSIDSDTQITATVPSGATTGPISVLTPDAIATSAENFTVRPEILSFSPTSGPVGTSVTITGSDFPNATDVQFNGTSASTFSIDSDTQITATVPSGATTGPISVLTPDGTATSTEDFTVLPQATGTIVFRSSRSGRNQIYKMNGDGSNVIQLTTDKIPKSNPVLSPDGSRIAFVEGSTNRDVYVMASDGTNIQQLTTDPSDDYYPTWSPDGTKIAFVGTRTGNHDVFTMNADGTDQIDITNAPSEDVDPNWSHEGTKIAFYSNRIKRNRDIWTMNADGTDQVDITNDKPAKEYAPAWSRDDTQIAYRSDATGNYDIWLWTLATGTAVNLTPTDAAFDRQPTWSLDGTMICYASNLPGKYDLYSMNADGTDPIDLTPDSRKTDDMPDWGT
jgi:dipeptidyl aminopeptidase/acylaminoacyl peptidase